MRKPRRAPDCLRLGSGLWICHCPVQDSAPVTALPPQLARARPARQAQYLAGRAAAAAAVGCLTGRAVAPGMNPDRSPAWPAGTIGSISHTRTHAIALAGDARRYNAIGVDLETLPEPASAPDLIRVILTPAERQRWAGEPEALLAGLVFSCKESLFKALYPLVGERFYFDAAELVSMGRNGRAILRLCMPLGPYPAGQRFLLRHARLDQQILTACVVPGLSDGNARQRI